MSSSLNMTYLWDEKTYIDASKHAYTYELKQSHKRFLGWIFIALTQFGVVSVIKGGGVGLLLLSGLLVLYWYILRWQLRKMMLVKSFATSPNANQTFYIDANEKEIHINSTKIMWEDILEAVSLKSGFLLYYDATFIFIPSHAFEDIEDKNTFATLAKENVTNYTRER